mgnify:CR=1 FL=1
MSIKFYFCSVTGYRFQVRNDPLRLTPGALGIIEMSKCCGAARCFFKFRHSAKGREHSVELCVSEFPCKEQESRYKVKHRSIEEL